MFSEDRIYLMKKPLKLYGWSWVAAIAATLITLAVMAICPSHHDLAQDVNNLEKIVKVDLPDIASFESSNNLDRTASRWDVFEHRGMFVSALSEETTIALDELCLTDSLHWHKSKDRSAYSYYDEGGFDGLYSVFCLISNEGFTTVYEIDEDEGIFIFLPIAIAFTILFKWGLCLIIIAFINRIKNRRKIRYETY